MREFSARAVSSGGDKRSVAIDMAIVIGAASVIGASLFLHFVRPHGDFYEFREAGYSILSGEFPETTKRGPVFPMLIALLGRAVAPFARGAPPAEQLGAALLNALLLPVTAALCYLIVRRWRPSAARWAGLAVVAAPHLWLASAHLLVEPLLATLLLATVLLAQRGSVWAYASAGVAALTRFDLAGLLVGVALADVARGMARRAVLLRFAGGCALPAVWLVITAWTWSTHSRDHYLAQMREHFDRGALSVDVGWAFRSALDAAGAGVSPGFPLWGADLRPALEFGIPALACVLIGVGAVTYARRRDAGMIVALCGLGAYLAVHAVFPFRLPRFGGPPAVLLIAIAVAGGGSLVAWVRDRSRVIGSALLAIGLLLGAVTVTWELDTLRAVWPGFDWGARVRVVAVCVAALAVAGVATWEIRRRVARERRGPSRSASWLPASAMLFVASASFVLASARGAQPLLGKRQQSSALVDAARWVCQELPPETKVLSGVGGLLALHWGSDTHRFPGFERIAADDWSAIVQECRARGIGYVIWYEDFLGEQGEYYIAKWRLGRFERLESGVAPGLQIVRYFAGDPNVVVYRVSPGSGPATRPSGGFSSGDGPTSTAPDGGGWPLPSPPRRSP